MFCCFYCRSFFRKKNNHFARANKPKTIGGRASWAMIYCWWIDWCGFDVDTDRDFFSKAKILAEKRLCFRCMSLTCRMNFKLILISFRSFSASRSVFAKSLRKCLSSAVPHQRREALLTSSFQHQVPHKKAKYDGGNLSNGFSIIVAIPFFFKFPLM